MKHYSLDHFVDHENDDLACARGIAFAIFVEVVSSLIILFGMAVWFGWWIATP